MPAIKRERCWGDRPHVADGTIAFENLNPDADTQVSRCAVCRQPLSRFYIDEEPGEKRGGWSAWYSKPYIIEEIGVP